MNSKKCFKCEIVKPLSEFYKHAQMADGHVNKCKECNKKDVRENYKGNIEHYKKYEKKRAGLPKRILGRERYAKSEAGKESARKSKKKWSDSNRIKRAASIMVGNAVRDGKLEKQYFCSVCSIDNVRIHGHHDDYAKPLEVRWLCSKCHCEWHKENGEGANAF
jgi:transposase-like protein